MDDFEANQREFASSLVAVYGDNLDYFQHVLNTLGSYTGDCPRTLHSMGTSLFQHNPALLQQFFRLYPWAKHSEEAARKDELSEEHSDEATRKNELSEKHTEELDRKDDLSVKHSEEAARKELDGKDDKSAECPVKLGGKDGLRVDASDRAGLKNYHSRSRKLKMSDVSLCSTVTNVSPQTSLSMKVEMSDYSKRKVKDTCDKLNKGEFKISIYGDVDDENRNIVARVNQNDVDIEKPLRRSSRVSKVLPSKYKNDLPEDVLLKVTQENSLVEEAEISDSSAESEFDFSQGHQSDSNDSYLKESYEGKIMESGNYFGSIKSEKEQNRNSKFNENEPLDELSCPKCKQIFKTKIYLKRHNKLVNCEEVRFTLTCPKCKKFFKKWRYLYEHTKSNVCQKTDKISQISCPKCNKHFKARKYLLEHIRLKNCNPIVKPLQCEKCNKVFTKKGYLEQHKIQNVNCYAKTVPSIELNKQSKSQELKCPKCNKSFNNKGHLTQHSSGKRCGQVKKPSARSSTSKITSSLPEIDIFSSMFSQEHKSQEFEIDKERNGEAVKEGKIEKQDLNITKVMPLQCEKCNKIFKEKAYLAKHKMENVNCHEKTKKCIKLSENEFQCPQCKQVFTTIRKLRWHRMKVHDPNPLICPQCNKTFSTRETLHVHSRVCKINPLKQFGCNICDTPFEDALELSIHLGLVHNRVCCSHCNRNFSNPRLLLQHFELAHETNFSCDQCDSCFTKKFHLTDHVRQIHVKLWRFPCLECTKQGNSIGFKRKKYWKSHMEKHHSHIDPGVCFDKSFREEFLGEMVDLEGKKSDALEASWENIREEVWEEMS